jgi:cytochrome c553
MRSLVLVLALLVPGLLYPASARPDGDRKPVADLQGEVLALLQARCVKCHGPDKAKVGLDLSSLEALGRGSKRGAVVLPGAPDDSPLWRQVHEESMPPDQPLPETERDLLRRWIEKGAPGFVARTLTHWAFKPPVRPAIPEVRHPDRTRTGVDRFIQAALETKGLSLGPEADRATLVRRVCFDLTGLPPTPAEIEAFLKDRSGDAYERLIERYLASPRYGERWGKFWLDAAGYADSNGYFSADSDRPLAWHYRDYVIRSFNADKPYDQFVREQLAGDELVGYVPGGDVTPAMVEGLTATHFLRNAPDGTAESDGNPDEVRTDRFTVLEGNLQNTMNCLLGLTIQCARCHDHKFEPVRQEEYYRLQAVLFSAYNPERWLKPTERVVAIGSRAEREDNRRRTDTVARQVKALQDGLATMAGPLREQLIEERLRDREPSLRDAILAAVRLPNDKRSKEQQALVHQHVEPLKITDDDLAKRFPEYAAVRDRVRAAIASREKERPRPLPELAVLTDTDPNPPAHHLLVRGQHNAPGKEVRPGVPLALCFANNTYHLDNSGRGKGTTGRRSAFARWVTATENPLFARVMVNRIWQHHFGKGLVATPDNLGQSGARPSHPELLDYLATEFIRSGYSIKSLHRLIVHSAVYRQTGATTEARQVDPDNRLLGHFPLRRLDAEAVRDGMLAVAGELDQRMGGPFVATQRTADGVEVNEKADGARKRSVYLQQRRTQVLTLLELFDAPSIVGTCGERTVSTVPLQSLALLNSPFARLRAAAFARRLETEAGTDETSRLTLAFRLACGREPRPEEQQAARQFLTEQRAVYAADKEEANKEWTDLCQMILASNAFLYVE